MIGSESPSLVKRDPKVARVVVTRPEGNSEIPSESPNTRCASLNARISRAENVNGLVPAND